MALGRLILICTPSIAPTQKLKMPSVKRPKPAASVLSMLLSPCFHAAIACGSFSASDGCFMMARHTRSHVR